MISVNTPQVQERPGQKSNDKSQSGHAKARQHHLQKSLPEGNLSGHRDVKAEQEDNHNGIENHET